MKPTDQQVPRWIWHEPTRDDTCGAVGLAKAKPDRQLNETEPKELGRILGPRGEVLSVAYDRRIQPFGFGVETRVLDLNERRGR